MAASGGRRSGRPRVLRTTFDASGGADGFVSIEVAPELAFDTEATTAAARALHGGIAEPNLYMKIPAMAGGSVHSDHDHRGPQHQRRPRLLPRPLPGGDRGVLLGDGDASRWGGDVAGVRSVASFVSRVDNEVDRRLEAAGAQVQRLWASTSTKDPALSDILYVDGLIGRDTVNSMPEATIDAFEDRGTLARTIVGRTFEAQGVAAFHDSLRHVPSALETKAHRLAA